MGVDDKARHTADSVKGKAKEATGKVSGDSELENEGRREQAESDLKQAGQKISDAVKR